MAIYKIGKQATLSYEHDASKLLCFTFDLSRVSLRAIFHIMNLALLFAR